jgi:cysteine-rich repeat protein
MMALTLLLGACATGQQEQDAELAADVGPLDEAWEVDDVGMPSVDDIGSRDAAASEVRGEDVAPARVDVLAPPPDRAAATDAGVLAPVDVRSPAADAGPTAPPPRCGDGFIDRGRGEVCDDGNGADGDLCAADCRSVGCSFARSFADPATGHCYWRESTVEARAAAAQRCQGTGGYLAAFESEPERSAVYPAMGLGGSNRTWIGLQNRDAAWRWDNNVALAYTGFRVGEPSGDGDCAEWGPSDSFNDIDCSNRRDTVCEREPAGTPR